MKDRKIYCLNNIAKIGTDSFRSGYTLIDSMDEAAGVLVRSADMKEMSFPAGLRREAPCSALLRRNVLSAGKIAAVFVNSDHRSASILWYDVILTG